MYFGLIIFKNQKEMERCNEIPEYLQNKILGLYKDIKLNIGN